MEIDDRTEWTLHVNRALARRAPSGLVAFGTGIGERYSAYLVDLCWSKPWLGMATYEGLVLAAKFEFEGSRPAIEEGLMKLVDVRAASRVFLGNLWGPDWAAADRIAQDACRMLQKHRWQSDQGIVLALGPRGQPRDQDLKLKMWFVNSSEADRME